MTVEAQYPAHWEADVVLADGGTAHVRPIRPADADRLRAFYSRLSDESIYFRFFGPRPRLSDREVAWFTNVDYLSRVALIATIGTEMVAVIRYDRTGPGEGEVAFLVEDAHQGRGVASVLLEHLAATARERGVERFVADVLPANMKMMGVLRQAGYTAETHFADGVVRMTLDLTPTETATEVTTAREHRAEARSIARLLTPGSVAVIGASREPGGVGHTALRNLLAADFTGPVYPVHREVRAMAGVRAYPSVTAIDDEVDLAVVAVPAEGVLDVVKECAEKGVHGLVVLSSGFGETGEAGRDRQDELARIARSYGLRVVGPNCLGIANTDPAVKLNATLAATVPGRGRVGFFSQSGALGTALLQRVKERGMGISSFVSAGNRADVSGNDLLQYWEEDASTEVILLYLESLGNPRKFTRLARRIARSKPIVVVKSGGTPAGHSAEELGLPDSAISSLFEQAGLIRVDDLIQLFDVGQLLAYQPLPAGPRVALITQLRRARPARRRRVPRGGAGAPPSGQPRRHRGSLGILYGTRGRAGLTRGRRGGRHLHAAHPRRHHRRGRRAPGDLARLGQARARHLPGPSRHASLPADRRPGPGPRLHPVLRRAGRGGQGAGPGGPLRHLARPSRRPAAGPRRPRHGRRPRPRPRSADGRRRRPASHATPRRAPPPTARSRRPPTLRMPPLRTPP